MQSKRINLPFPRNTDYGRGATRRRVRLVNGEGVTTGHLVDIFHAMDCRIEHDGEHVTAAHGEMRRIPNTACPGAPAMLRELVGMPIATPVFSFYAGGRARRNCTHLLDLAVLTISHATRAERERVYEAIVPDELDEPVTIEVLMNGQRVHAWQSLESTVRGPGEFVGRPLCKGFVTWAGQRFAGDELEAAMVLAHTYLISRGREYETEAFTGQPITRNPLLNDVCFAYAAERRDQALFLPGNTRDFSTGIPDDA